MNLTRFRALVPAVLVFTLAGVRAEVTYPPKLRGGQEKVTVTSEEFLKAPGTLLPGVAVAKTPPKVELLFYPGQNYPGNPWSAWGDSLVANGKYYASIGDHLSLGGDKGNTTGGNAFIFEYDPATGKARQLADVKKVLGLPPGHYTPGKVHGRLDTGSDGWLYFATYRGGNSTTPQYHYKGDWIIRMRPETGVSEIVAQGAVPGHGIQTSIVDPERMILYGGTRAGSLKPSGDGRVADDELFIAYDLRAKKLLYSTPKTHCWPWPVFARSGRVYFAQGIGNDAVWMRYDPATGGPAVKIEGPAEAEGASTMETPQGIIYMAGVGSSKLWAFDTKKEKFTELGPACIGDALRRISSIDADPGGRYLYYTPGAHGGSEVDGTPIVQFDVQTKQRKVIAFLNPVLEREYGCTLRGTYSSAIDPAGDKLYVTWNVSRGTKVWDSCALTVVHIPASERP